MFTKQASKGIAYIMLIAYTFVIISNKLNTRPSLKVNLQNKELVWKNEFELSVKKGLMAKQRNS